MSGFRLNLAQNVTWLDPRTLLIYSENFTTTAATVSRNVAELHTNIIVTKRHRYVAAYTDDQKQNVTDRRVITTRAPPNLRPYTKHKKRHAPGWTG